MTIYAQTYETCIYTLEVNHHFENGGSFWKMINLTIKNGGSETNL